MRHKARQSLDLYWPSAFWIFGALGTILFAGVLTALSPRFGYGWDVIDMPVPTLTALLVSAGVIYFVGVALATKSQFSIPFGNQKTALALMVVAGVVARLILLASEPALEDDYQRYLWDGAVTANGFNPYAVTPEQVTDAGDAHPLSSLAKSSGLVLERVNHPSLTTIYPPVAQAAFALAHIMKPFSLVAWRSVLFVADVATLALIIALLGLVKRSPLWSAVYWWNPVVLKEFFNSAHMDGLILPFVLGALYLALRMRPLSATIALACAVGIKIWPALLLPLVWRRAIKQRSQLIVCGLIFCLICAVWFLPYLSAGLNENSGIVAYAERWTTNSPLFASLHSLLSVVFSSTTEPGTIASQLARFIVASCVSVIALLMAVRSINSSTDFITRALVIVAALIFLSPAIYPWYTVWMLPLLVIVPYLGLILVSATIPLYYSFFYFAARETASVYDAIIVWLVWVPVWVLCAKTLFDAYWSGKAETLDSEEHAARKV